MIKIHKLRSSIHAQAREAQAARAADTPAGRCRAIAERARARSADAETIVTERVGTMKADILRLQCEIKALKAAIAAPAAAPTARTSKRAEAHAKANAEAKANRTGQDRYRAAFCRQVAKLK